MRVDGWISPGALPQHRADDFGERARGRDRLFVARLHDRPRDRPRETLLAERGDDGGKIAVGGGVDEIGGAKTLAAHAHVERTVVAEREPAFRLIELHRRDAEIEQDAVDRAMAETLRDMFEIGEAVFHQGEPALRLLDQSEALGHRIAVAVDADDARAAHIQDAARVPAGAERAVDGDAAIARRQKLQHLAGKHGNMTGQSASGRVAAAAHHHSRAFCASCAATREPSCFFNARTVPVASASCARKRPGSQI